LEYLLANSDIIGATTVAEHFTVCIGMSSCPHDFLLTNGLIILMISTGKTGVKNIVALLDC